jgi:hypothetical protein
MLVSPIEKERTMTTSNVADILIALALVAWIMYRQFTWQLVSLAKLWKMPVIVAAVGIIMLAQSKSLTAITPIDIGILAVELIISLGLGAAMGSMARFRTRPQTAADVSSRRNPSAAFNPAVTVIESRTGALGAALWLVLIAIRIGIEIAVNHYFHSAFLSSTGTILLVVAGNRVARALVVAGRMERRGLVTA